MKKTFVVITLLSLQLIHSAQAQTLNPQSFSDVTYEVPVKADLQPFARFAITDFQELQTPTGAEYSYTLPDELTGVPGTRLTFKLVGTEGGNFALHGDNGDAQCAFEKTTTMSIAESSLQDSPHVACHIVYKNLKIDSTNAAAIIRAKFANTPDVENRVQVARAFSTEPIGTLRYGMSP